MNKYRYHKFIELFGVPISITSRSQALALVGEWVREYRKSQLKSAKSAKIRLQKKSDKSESDLSDLSTIRFQPILAETPTFPKIITTPNPEIIVAAQSDPELLTALQAADLAIPDGIGIVWALGLPSRLSGLDLLESLISEAARRGWKVMLLGGRPGVAQKAATNLRHLIRPGLASQGRAFIKAISGPQDIAAVSPHELNELIAQINAFSPDLLFVAFGHPKQEKWLTANRYRLTAGVAMAVGGALDQIADPSLRPPIYINSIGLGWLYRLLRQPQRWRRQLALLKFVWMIFREKLK